MYKPVPLIFSFFLAFLATVYAPVFFPYTRFHTFVPFLALLYARCSKISCLWISGLCGLIIDMLSSDMRFGTHALSFVLATLLLYHQKKHFYQEKPLALSLFTFQLSVAISLTLFLFSQHLFSAGLKWIIVDLFFMACIDALYAFFWFSCPLLLYRHLFSKRSN